jgi:hypothetical protein
MNSTVNKKSLTHKLLGEILIEAGLVSFPQLEVALNEQKQYLNLRLGEIFALHGWLKQETSDFFAESWVKLLQENNKHPLGYYLQKAGILTLQQIKEILDEQKRLGVKFGSIAVLHGWLNDQTLEFFLKHLAAESLNKSAFITPGKDNYKKGEKSELVKLDEPEKQGQKKQFIRLEPDEIPWIG